MLLSKINRNLVFQFQLISMPMLSKLHKLLKKVFKEWEPLFKKQLKILVVFLVELVPNLSVGNRKKRETPLISILVMMKNKKVHMTNTKKNSISSKHSSKLQPKHSSSNNLPMMLMKLLLLHHKLLLLNSHRGNIVCTRTQTYSKRKKTQVLDLINNHSFKHHPPNRVIYSLEWVQVVKLKLLLQNKNSNHHLRTLSTFLMKVHRMEVMSPLIRKTLQQVSMVQISVSLSHNNNLHNLLMFQLPKFQIRKRQLNISKKKQLVKTPGTNLS